MGKTKKAPNPDKLHLGKFLAWRGGAFSLAANFLVMTFLTIYCTDALMMPPALVGSILLVSKIFDAVGELYCGYIVDNSKVTRFGKGRPFDLLFIGLWGCTILLFSVPISLSLPFKVIWVFAMYMLVQSVFQSLIQAASMPYMMRAWANKNVMVKLQSFGGVVGMLLSIVFNIAFPIFVRMYGHSASGWTKLMVMVAVPMCIIGLTRFFFVKENYAPQKESHEERIKISEVIDILKSNKYVWIVAGINGLIQLIPGLAANTYYFTWVVGDISKLGTISMVSIILLPIMFFVPRIIRKYSISLVITVGSVFGVIGASIAFFAGANITILMVAALFTGIALLAPPYLTPIMLVDCATYNRYIGKKPMEGTIQAVCTFGGNVGTGIGAQITGLVLALSGYVGNAAMQSSSTIFGIRSLYTLVPIIVYILLLLSAKAFTLEKKIPEMEAEMKVREVTLG